MDMFGACTEGDLFFVKEDDYCGDVNQADDNEWTPLKIARLEGNLDFVKFLKAKGVKK